MERSCAEAIWSREDSEVTGKEKVVTVAQLTAVSQLSTKASRLRVSDSESPQPNGSPR